MTTSTKSLALLAFQEAAAQYPGALRRSIIEVRPITRAKQRRERYDYGSKPKVPAKSRVVVLACEHEHTDTVTLASKAELPPRAVGDVLLCAYCAGVPPGINALLDGHWAFWTLVGRTLPRWAPLFKNGGVYDAPRLWARVKPMLREEFLDPRLDEYFEIRGNMQRRDYEPESVTDARVLALMPALASVLLRDPVEHEPPSPKAKRTRAPKTAPAGE